MAHSLKRAIQLENAIRTVRNSGGSVGFECEWDFVIDEPRRLSLLQKVLLGSPLLRCLAYRPDLVTVTGARWNSSLAEAIMTLIAGGRTRWVDISETDAPSSDVNKILSCSDHLIAVCLDGTGATDRECELLEEKQALSSATLRRTEITPAAVSKLCRTRPELTVGWELGQIKGEDK